MVISLFVELELKAIAQELYELIWLKIIIDDLRIKWEGPMKLHCDKKLTINIAYSLTQHKRIKHVEIDRHFIKEKLKEELVCMLYVL